MKSILFLAIATVASAHYTLDYPASLGFSDENENIAPCGGFLPNLDSALVNFSIAGDWIAINNHHPESLLHYRVANEDNLTWIELNPIVHQVGIGKLCIKTGAGPSDFVGKRGVVQVIGDGHGGALYQCVQARFVNDTASTPTADQCSNGTAITAQYDPTAVFGVPSVAYNATSVQVSGSAAASSASVSATASANATTTPTSDATFQRVNSVAFGIVMLGLLVGMMH